MSSSSLRLLSLNHLPAAAALLWGLSLAIVRAWQPIDYFWENFAAYWLPHCLLYTSDAADE